jgi:hypothetical protein
MDILSIFLPKVYFSFCLYNQLIKTLESDNCSFGQLSQIYSEFLIEFNSQLNEISSQPTKLFAQDFLKGFAHRMEKTCDINLIRLVSSFTLTGRRLLRSELGLLGIRNSDSFDMESLKEQPLFHFIKKINNIYLNSIKQLYQSLLAK